MRDDSSPERPAPPGAAEAPEPTALRVALWRALHVQADPPPHILEDTLGLALAAPEEGWRLRPDMELQGTRGYRASIVGRARFIEDLVTERAAAGVEQYVLLGAGLDTFAQRRPELATRLRIFEVDRPAPQAWKRRRLAELGLAGSEALTFVPVDFEAGPSWWDALASSGFRPDRPALVASTGVSMYLTPEANEATLRRLSTLAPGSTLAMTFLLPLDLLDPAERPQHEAVYARARAAGTPFLSFYRPGAITALARQAGFRQARHVSTEDLVQAYFTDRTDGLRPSTGEAFLVAGT